MTTPRLAAVEGRVLSRRARAPIAPPAAEDRARAIDLIERAIGRRRRRRLAVMWTFAAAAIAVLGLGVRHFVPRGEALAERRSAPSRTVTVVGYPAGGGATVVGTGSPAPLADGKSLARGSRILARSDGHVLLSVSTGTRLTVEEGGDLSIVDSGADQVFALGGGAVRAEVAKLEPHERFIIRTPDSEVEVRGTSFRVAIAESDPACEGGTVTRVSVKEGVVAVRHDGQEARVAAGKSWPSACVARAVPTVPRSPRGVAATGQAKPSSPESAPSTAASVAAESDLREQNDAFARAFAAKRRGATAEAIQGFESFVARYPTSSLVESAFAQRMQLLRGLDPARARAAAEQYLSRFPRGFARVEAQSIAGQVP